MGFERPVSREALSLFAPVAKVSFPPMVSIDVNGPKLTFEGLPVAAA